MYAAGGVFTGIFKSTDYGDTWKSTGGSVPGDRLILAQLYENQARSTPDPAAASAKPIMAANLFERMFLILFLCCLQQI
jgi:hypothetical protein